MIERYSDHAANERTFLAWVRTAIAIMAFGFLVQKFDLFLRIASASLGVKSLPAGSRFVGTVAGLLLIVLGGVMMALAAIRFRRTTLDIDAAAVFPTQHMVRVIEAARTGKNLLDFPVFDGSDTGEKVYDTLTVVGHRLTADERKHDDAAADEPKLSAVPRWPVTISYFAKNKAPDSGEQTPDYALSFELYENGISRALMLDYNDFVVKGKLASLELKPQKPCP